LTVVSPAGTVTLAGTTKAVFVDESVTVTPPIGAGDVRLTVSTASSPPRIVDGFSAILVSAGAVRERFAVRETPFSVAVTTAST
jgi:hypothetical protein